MSTKPVKPQAASAPLIKNSAAAPVVYFDNVPVFGAFQGNIEAELTHRALMPKPDATISVEIICAGHLRCSAEAAVMLIDALQKALALRAKQIADGIEKAKAAN